MKRSFFFLGAWLTLSACYQAPGTDGAAPQPPTVKLTDVPGHEGLVDGRHKDGPRMLAGESYLRSYMMLFGDISPAEVARAARGAEGNELFVSWKSHLGALGLPDYGADIARGAESNTIMLATYERLGVALCDRAAERDLKSARDRRVFDFDLAKDPLDRAAFDAGFDVLHRTFLGYPASLASGRGDRFFRLYSDVLARHAAPGAAPSKLTPPEAGWSVVCYGLVRHPEFHLY